MSAACLAFQAEGGRLMATGLVVKRVFGTGVPWQRGWGVDVTACIAEVDEQAGASRLEARMP